ncbi:unnamed protein product [Cochlearia groenlandica]
MNYERQHTYLNRGKNRGRIQGLEKIENLQSHDNIDIYQKAVKILESYWEDEEEEENNVGHENFQLGGNQSANAPPTGGFNFG